MSQSVNRRDVLKCAALNGAVWIASTLCGEPLLRSQQAPASSPVAHTKSGRVQGYVDRGICVFKGIPYGADTATTRFRPPAAPPAWKDIRTTVEFGPRAPQPPGHAVQLFDSWPEEGPVGEDCLHINVWTPRVGAGKRPVMVWIHGGGYINYSSNSIAFDGVNLCRKGDVVVVSMNHRLNLFGHLYLGELGGEAYADSGNVGMLDLVLALQWVRDNISAFSGDPGNVLIFGQSGGGAKCATLMAMPSARGLFHKVVTESGQQLTGSRKQTATTNAKLVLNALNVTPDKIATLDQMPMNTLIAAAHFAHYYGPVTDGRSLPRDPFSPDAPPLSADIPMLMGNTHDETRLLIGGGDPATFTLTWETLPDKIQRAISQFIGTMKVGDIVAFYRNLYPSYSASDVFFAATTAFRSWPGQVIEAERRARQAEQQKCAPTWVYQLNWKTPVDGGKWGAPHALDIPLTFDNVAVSKSMAGDTPESYKMAGLMSDAWLHFAHKGTPAASSLPAWPTYDLKSRQTMIFDLPPRIESDPRGAERRFASQVEYIQPGT
jgi:para-nitrobenzyl esterase